MGFSLVYVGAEMCDGFTLGYVHVHVCSCVCLSAISGMSTRPGNHRTRRAEHCLLGLAARLSYL